MSRAWFATARFVIAGLALLPAAPAVAHFSILLPEKTPDAPGDPAVFRFFTGHPYECELVNTPTPESVRVLHPDGHTWTDLKPRPLDIEPPADPAGPKITVQGFEFRPAERGGHLLCVITPRTFDPHEEAVVQDVVLCPLRVATRNGWDHPAGTAIELVPLTMPFGLEPGFAVRFQLRLHGRSVAGAEVEIEKYHRRPPETLPADESLITRVVRTDDQGLLVATLDEPGWWVLCGTTADGKATHDGREYPLVRRALYWLFVHPRTDTDDEGRPR